MALRPDNSTLWLVLGLSLGYVAARRIVRDLYRVRDLTEITRPENDERMISQGTEDALKLETLEKLTESPSYELRGASLRIISERATKENSRDLLLQDLASKNKRQRHSAVTALHFLVSTRAFSRSNTSPRLRDLPIYIAIVDALCNLLEEHTVEYSTTESPVLPKTRPPGERKLLATLNILLPENIPAALEAGIVSRWLANYPFPCLTSDADYPINYLDNPHGRKDVVWLMRTYWPDDTLMSSIVTTLANNTDAIRQLRKYNLMDSFMKEVHEQDDDDHDVLMINGESTAGRRRWVPERLSLPEESFEEQALRRRRREAMVYSENGGPIGNENIIQPPRV